MLLRLLFLLCATGLAVVKAGLATNDGTSPGSCPSVSTISSMNEFAEWWICEFVQYRHSLPQWHYEIQKRQKCAEKGENASAASPPANSGKDLSALPIISILENIEERVIESQSGSGEVPSPSHETAGREKVVRGPTYWHEVGSKWVKFWGSELHRQQNPYENVKKGLGANLRQEWGSIWENVRNILGQNNPEWAVVGPALGEEEREFWRRYGKMYGNVIDSETKNRRHTDPNVVSDSGDRDYGTSLKKNMQRQWRDVWSNMRDALGKDSTLWGSIGRVLENAENGFWQRVNPALNLARGAGEQEKRDHDDVKNKAEFISNHINSITGSDNYFWLQVQPRLYRNQNFWEHIMKMIQNGDNDIWKLIKDSLNVDSMFWRDIRSKILHEDTFWAQTVKLLRREDKFWELLHKTLGENRQFWERVRKKLTNTKEFWEKMRFLIEGDDFFWDNLKNILSGRDFFWRLVRHKFKTEGEFRLRVEHYLDENDLFWNSLNQELSHNNDLWNAVRRTLSNDKIFWLKMRKMLANDDAFWEEMQNRLKQSDGLWHQIRLKISPSQKFEQLGTTLRSWTKSWMANYPSKNLGMLLWDSLFKCPLQPKVSCVGDEKLVTFTDGLGCEICYCPSGKYKGATPLARSLMANEIEFTDASLIYDYLVPPCNASAAGAYGFAESAWSEELTKPVWLRWLADLLPIGLPPLPSNNSKTPFPASEVEQRITTPRNLIITSPLSILFPSAGSPSGSSVTMEEPLPAVEIHEIVAEVQPQRVTEGSGSGTEGSGV